MLPQISEMLEWDIGLLPLAQCHCQQGYQRSSNVIVFIHSVHPKYRYMHMHIKPTGKCTNSDIKATRSRPYKVIA